MAKIEINLLELMAKNKIRQIKELHEMTGISRTVIAEILNGKREQVRMDTIAKLCEALHCDVGDLLKINRGA